MTTNDDGDELAITGLGAICAAGTDVRSLWEAVLVGRSGLRPVRAYDTSAFAGAAPVDARASSEAGARAAWAGEVDGDPADRLPDGLATGDRVVDLALVAALEAWADARAAGAGPLERIAVVVGTSAGSLVAEELHLSDERKDPLTYAPARAWAHHRRVAVAVGDAIGARGPRLTPSSACTSGNVALALAADLLRADLADRVLVGGVDGLSRRRHAGFDALGALAPGPCVPFGSPYGMNPGEGAAFLVLERPGRVRSRASWLGAGLSADAYHATAPDPTGAGVARAVTLALVEGGARPDEVGWYDAHGTGTDHNDAAEWAGAARALGASADAVPASGPKAFFGHTFGGAGALEAVLAVLALEHQVVPPTPGLIERRPGAPPDVVGDGPARPARVDVVVSHNAAFGGHNAAVVLGRPGRRPPRSRPRDVFVSGSALVGAGPLDAWASLMRGEPVPADPHEAPIRRARPDMRALRADPREFDPIARLVGAACHAALADAGLRLGGDLRDRAGLFVGHSSRPPSTNEEFHLSYDRGRTSALAFSRTVSNGAAGVVSRVLGLRGPQAVLVTGAGSGLITAAWAALRLSVRDDADLIVAVGADEIAAVRRDLDPEQNAAPRGPASGFAGDGAAALVLARQGPVRIAGVGLAGTFAEAVRRAGGGEVGLVVSAACGERQRGWEDEGLAGCRIGERAPSPSDVFGYGDAWTASAALTRAARHVAAGDARSALVVAGHAETGAAAIRLEQA